MFSRRRDRALAERLARPIYGAIGAVLHSLIE